MNAKEFYSVVKALEKSKYELFYNEGIGFDLCAVNKKSEEDWTHVAIGTGEQRTQLLLGAIFDMFQDVKGRVTAEQFADTIKAGFLKLVELKNTDKPADDSVSEISIDNHSGEE
ncbi:MAG: hypothetical protein IK093_17780 [Ruminiclostridium sp.]|nr:hypothetical protein [Ruminiclostridium sp.]